MNIETGQIYRTDDEIDAARTRGEPLMKLSPDQQKLLGIGAARRRRQARRQQRAQRALDKALAQVTTT